MRTFFFKIASKTLYNARQIRQWRRCLLILAGKQTIEKTASGARWLDINSQI